MVELYGAALVAISIAISAILSSRLRISSAIFEVVAGIILGNLLGVKLESWLDFLGTYGGLVLTFLAGAEVEFHILRKKAKASLVIGSLAFIAPLIAEFLFLSIVTNWTLQAKISVGLALTTTSVAVVYAILTEYEIIKLPASRIIIAVTFVNDILTLIGINLISPSFDVYVIVTFFTLIGILIIAIPKLLGHIVERYGRRAVEMELRFILASMLGVAVLADVAKLHAVFGAFVLGLVFASTIQKYQDVLSKMRTVTFSLLSPAFFIRAGLLIGLPAVIQNIALIMGLLAVKLLSKFAGTYLLSKKWIDESAGMFSALLFSTGLTVGSITATLARDLHFIDQTQFSVAIVTVILSAIVPTLLAKRFVPQKI
ncbi:MAG TPA: cation:proton antiporter [Nitrososphaeraceae archaeon]|nr:cation:proton antiporter [Nitrososphaeraceae archaeon]